MASLFNAPGPLSAGPTRRHSGVSTGPIDFNAMTPGQMYPMNTAPRRAPLYNPLPNPFENSFALNAGLPQGYGYQQASPFAPQNSFGPNPGLPGFPQLTGPAQTALYSGVPQTDPTLHGVGLLAPTGPAPVRNVHQVHPDVLPTPPPGPDQVSPVDTGRFASVPTPPLVDTGRRSRSGLPIHGPSGGPATAPAALRRGQVLANRNATIVFNNFQNAAQAMGLDYAMSRYGGDVERAAASLARFPAQTS